jgi:putative transposase
MRSRPTREDQKREHNGQLSLMPAFQVAEEKQTKIAKLQSYSNSIPAPTSSLISPAVLISKEQDLEPFWSESVEAMSDLLWLPTMTNLPEKGLTPFPGCTNNTAQKSWFQTKTIYPQNENWFRVSLPLFIDSVPDSSPSGSISLQSKKIRIYPSSELEKIWKKWLGACRYCFNQAIAMQRESDRLLGKLKLRNRVMQSDLPQWVKETPCHIRQNAIFDAHQAYTESRDAKFRSVRNPRQTIKFNDSNYTKGTWFCRLTKTLEFKASEPIPHQCDYGTQLVYRRGKWFAIFPEPVIKSHTDSRKIIALDPGVRTFLTGYDGDKVIEIGNGDMGRITRLCQHLDNLISRSTKVNARGRRSMRKAANRMREKIQNLIDEVHKKAAHYLTTNYELIFLPRFESSQMVAKSRRKIRSKTVRSMLTWAHYRFKLTLKHQAAKRGCVVLDVGESHTSQTCGACGHRHTKLGGSKIHFCPNCGSQTPRDANSARNNVACFEGFLLYCQQ